MLSNLIIKSYLCGIIPARNRMILEYANEDIKLLVRQVYTKRYKKYRSNKALRMDLGKVVRLLASAPDINAVRQMRSLNFEWIAERQCYSVRVGYSSKFRLLMDVREETITLILIELTEHYGDH